MTPSRRHKLSLITIVTMLFVSIMSSLNSVNAIAMALPSAPFHTDSAHNLQIDHNAAQQSEMHQHLAIQVENTMNMEADKHADHLQMAHAGCHGKTQNQCVTKADSPSDKPHNHAECGEFHCSSITFLTVSETIFDGLSYASQPAFSMVRYQSITSSSPYIPPII